MSTARSNADSTSSTLNGAPVRVRVFGLRSDRLFLCRRTLNFFASSSVHTFTYLRNAKYTYTQARQIGYEILSRTLEYLSIANPMSVVSLAVRQGNPVTEATVQQLASQISTGMVIENPQDVKDFTAILAAFHDSALSILEMDDYVPPALLPDLERYPRENISYPTKGSPVRYFDLPSLFF